VLEAWVIVTPAGSVSIPVQEVRKIITSKDSNAAAKPP
jgi:hypothetical protein